MLTFFDANVAIGRWKHPTYGSYETVDQLEEVLDYLQVERAVVFHAGAQEMHAPIGNRMLLDQIQGHERLVPSWVIFPHYTGEMSRPRELVDEMISLGVRVARLLPGISGHRFSMEAWCAGDLMEELEDRHFPVMIDFMFFRRDDPDWRLLHAICTRYPRLPIILTGWAGLASRSFYALCNACPNLYLETSHYAIFRGILAFCEAVGPRQLLFGSGMPFMGPGVAMSTITHALVSDEIKQKIAFDNFQHILNRVIL